MSSNLIRARGLVTYRTELNTPDGAMEVADNAIIDETGVVEVRRGFAEYGTELPNTSDRVDQVFEYKDKVLRHIDDTLQYDSDGQGTFLDFNGTYESPDGDRRIRSVETNSNFYFTTADGVKKISSLGSSDFTTSAGYIQESGAVKGINLEATSVVAVGGFLEPESKCAYRVVWGYRDRNNNLILGAPSQQEIAENPSATDFTNVDIEIQVPDGVNNTEYFYQLYRTANVTASGAVPFDELDPGDEMNLVFEEGITEADILAGFVTVNDIVPESFRASGAFLYTNPNSGEGILQANERPPVCKDLAVFRNTTFYANTKTVHRLTINLLSVLDFTNGVSDFIIGNSDAARTYTFDSTEDIPTQQALLSTNPSVGIAIDETAKSLVRVINGDDSSPVYAYYLSTPSSLPGQILLENRVLTDKPFYLATSDSNITDNFNPNLQLTETITAITAGNPTTIESAGHGLVSGNEVYIYGTDSTPNVIGAYEVTVLNANEFTINFETTVSGTTGLWYKTTTHSDNEEAANRLYFSKTSQPEAVPLLNFIDIGAKDEPIERILALRDSLFVLKSDGVYIVTGTTSPNFASRLLDRSTKIVAPDSADVLNNQIFFLSSEGVVAATEAGIQVVSRSIEDIILGVTNSNFNYRFTSFGVSYDSDRSYILWIPTLSTDNVATQAVRYNTFTQTWTRWTTSATCGLNMPFDDKLYIGSGDRPYLNIERKSGLRSDYADRDFPLVIQPSGVNSQVVSLDSVADLEQGDVIVQEQTVTLSVFRRLTARLDVDTGLTDTDYSSLNPSQGGNMASALDLLNAKLLADDSSGTITAKSFTNDFTDMQTKFNTLIGELNDPACDTTIVNYDTVDRITSYEAVVESINVNNTSATVNIDIPFIEGAVTAFKGIRFQISYTPVHFGDQSLMKQVRDGTIMFDQNNFYGATASYSSDLSKNFEDIPVTGRGIGDWGYGNWGDFIWGGEGSEVPFRTYIPQQKQRCRFLRVRFTHINARENTKILGISLNARPISRRAYR